MEFKYTPPKSSFIQRLLWKAAGADRALLEKSTYSDHVKYACLGGIVTSTGFMAALAGGYAFYIIFEPKGDAIGTIREVGERLQEHTDPATAILATLFGIIWGLVIFNIDRFIVASTGKGDGTEKITSQEFRSAIPRIIMGMIIAITISKPVEIRMFKTEIDVVLKEKQQEQEASYRKNIDERYNPMIEDLRQQITNRKDEIKAKEEIRNDKSFQYEEEIAGRVGSGKSGIGPAANAKKAALDLAQRELDQIENENKPEIARLEARILSLEEDRLKDLEVKEKVANGLDGLLERIKIAHEIAGTWITLFITLLFMAIELTPIFFKMMLIKSPYDYLDENLKELMKAEQGIEVIYGAYENGTGVEIDRIIYHKAKSHLDQKIKALEAQKALSDLFIETWKQDHIEKIKSNPEDYYEK